LSHPSIANQTDFVDVMEYANVVSDNVYGFGILIALFVIILLHLKMNGDDFPSCIAVSGFITSIAAVFLFLLGIVDSSHLFLCIFVAVIGIVWTFINNSS